MMSEAVVVAAIVAIPPTVAAVAALIVSIRTHSATREVHLSVNSRMDELLRVTKTSGIAEGRKAERDGTP